MPVEASSNFSFKFEPRSFDIPGDYTYEFRYYWYNLNDVEKGYETIGTITFTVTQKVETEYLRLVGNNDSTNFKPCDVFKE